MIKEAIAQLVGGRSLTIDEASAVMTEIMEGNATPAQFGAFVTALRLKGETVEEIAGLARTMRAKALRVNIDEPVVDTCGTGGDGLGTFNISTAAAFVAAACGLKIAKHGNRAMSSQCGSADVLEALGVKIDLNPEQVQKCLGKVGIGFMLAPVFHPAMKYAAAPRKEVGIRTVFNILGPLTNPAGATAQVLGVPEKGLTEKMATVLKMLGCQHALVVHGEDGLDEITVTGKTFISELKNGSIENYEIAPEGLGLPRTKPGSLKGGTAQENADLLRSILSGRKGAQRDIVLMNAAAALIAGDKTKTLAQGIALAGEVIDNGKALQKVTEFVKFSQNPT
ncbi:MAG: anthranilate phosphoribosyltransferase [Dehalococcoidales bacterium]|nr:anthranilate phosphoribosyltransferase [Dehalococcoidales bacterium]